MAAHESGPCSWNDFALWEEELPPGFGPKVDVIDQLVKTERLDLDNSFKELNAQCKRLGLSSAGDKIIHRFPLGDGFLAMYGEVMGGARSPFRIRLAFNRFEINSNSASGKVLRLYDYNVWPGAKTISLGQSDVDVPGRICGPSELPPGVPPIIWKSTTEGMKLFPGAGYKFPEPLRINRATLPEEVRIYRQLVDEASQALNLFTPGVTDEIVQNYLDQDPLDP